MLADRLLELIGRGGAGTSGSCVGRVDYRECPTRQVGSGWSCRVYVTATQGYPVQLPCRLRGASIIGANANEVTMLQPRRCCVFLVIEFER